MYEPGKIMILRRSINPPSASVELIDINAPAPVWKNAESMKWARRHQTATMLPDGTVLVTAGPAGTGDNNCGRGRIQREMFDPKTGHWTTWPRPRSAHLPFHRYPECPMGAFLPAAEAIPAILSRMRIPIRIFRSALPVQGRRAPAIDARSRYPVLRRPRFTVATKSTSIAQVTLLKNAAMTHASTRTQDFQPARVHQDGRRP